VDEQNRRHHDDAPRPLEVRASVRPSEADVKPRYHHVAIGPATRHEREPARASHFSSLFALEAPMRSRINSGPRTRTDCRIALLHRKQHQANGQSTRPAARKRPCKDADGYPILGRAFRSRLVFRTWRWAARGCDVVNPLLRASRGVRTRVDPEPHGGFKGKEGTKKWDRRAGRAHGGRGPIATMVVAGLTSASDGRNRCSHFKRPGARHGAGDSARPLGDEERTGFSRRSIRIQKTGGHTVVTAGRTGSCDTRATWDRLVYCLAMPVMLGSTWALIRGRGGGSSSCYPRKTGRSGWNSRVRRIRSHVRIAASGLW